MVQYATRLQRGLHERKESSTTSSYHLPENNVVYLHMIYCNQYTVQSIAKALLLAFLYRNWPACLPLSMILESLAKID